MTLSELEQARDEAWRAYQVAAKEAWPPVWPSEKMARCLQAMERFCNHYAAWWDAAQADARERALLEGEGGE